MAGHRIVVVEDEQSACELVCEVLRLQGDEPIAAGTVEEALPLIAATNACGYVFDQQLVLNASSLKAYETGGERVIEAARAIDSRHNGKGHVTPILALTGAGTSHTFVSGLFKLGVDAFVPKPLGENLALFRAEWRDMFARAGREEHGKCAGLSVRGASAHVGDAAVRIAIDGKVTAEGRSEIVINDARADMQDAKFLIVLRAIVARGQSEGAWSSRHALGIGDDRGTTARIQEAFDGLVPKGFKVIESDRRTNCRLHPDVVVERVHWAALTEHPHDGVRKLAIEERRRQERA
jgi:DNA-binding response OmpR family regulator